MIIGLVGKANSGKDTTLENNDYDTGRNSISALSKINY